MMFKGLLICYYMQTHSFVADHQTRNQLQTELKLNSPCQKVARSDVILGKVWSATYGVPHVFSFNHGVTLGDNSSKIMLREQRKSLGFLLNTDAMGSFKIWRYSDNRGSTSSNTLDVFLLHLSRPFPLSNISCCKSFP
ncbi:hypothetical protein PVAP13_2NG230046 [Panicum virgatum]|uniref:Uncharacterized protein n=1 Tax=Panicum virgatum TaxID=38727 RepID=A0A8T0VHD5_PANVG|nr:hypothetical protein PVAP13_2NG230046 [Panicum virgatum]